MEHYQAFRSVIDVKIIAGPISSIKSMGLTFIIVNDATIAFDLLERRASIYSDRYVPTFAGEMYVVPDFSATETF